MAVRWCGRRGVHFAYADDCSLHICRLPCAPRPPPVPHPPLCLTRGDAYYEANHVDNVGIVQTGPAMSTCSTSTMTDSFSRAEALFLVPSLHLTAYNLTKPPGSSQSSAISVIPFKPQVLATTLSSKRAENPRLCGSTKERHPLDGGLGHTQHLLPTQIQLSLWAAWGAALAKRT